MPPAAPPTLQSASVETYLGPSYATFQSAVKSSQQQAAPSFATRSRVEHVNTSLSASDSDGMPAGPAAAATTAPSAALSDGDVRAKQQQQRSFAAIGFNYNSTNNAGTPSSVVAPMPMAMPAALKRPRSPSGILCVTQPFTSFVVQLTATLSPSVLRFENASPAGDYSFLLDDVRLTSAKQ